MGVWMDAVLMYDGTPVARVVQHGDGGPDELRPLGPRGWAALVAYMAYATAWGAPLGIVHEPADALTVELLDVWAQAADA